MANGKDFEGQGVKAGPQWGGAFDPPAGGGAAAGAQGGDAPGAAGAQAIETAPLTPGDPGYSYPDSEEATEPYRNKAVINQRGATVEINNSTDREELKIHL